MTRSDSTSGQPRDSRGNFVLPEHGPERDAEAFRLRARSRTLSEIAEQLGYVDASHVRKALSRHMKATVGPAMDEYRREMDSQLDEMQRAAMKVLENRHYTISNGAAVYLGDPDTEDPLEDDGPVLQAIKTILQVQERRAKLWGLDAPTKVQAEVSNVRITIEGAEDV